MKKTTLDLHTLLDPEKTTARKASDGATFTPPTLPELEKRPAIPSWLWRRPRDVTNAYDSAPPPAEGRGTQPDVRILRKASELISSPPSPPPRPHLVLPLQRPGASTGRERGSFRAGMGDEGRHFV